MNATEAATYTCNTCGAGHATVGGSMRHAMAKHPETVKVKSSITPEQMAAGLATMDNLRDRLNQPTGRTDLEPCAHCGGRADVEVHGGRNKVRTACVAHRADVFAAMRAPRTRKGA